MNTWRQIHLKLIEPKLENKPLRKKIEEVYLQMKAIAVSTGSHCIPSVNWLHSRMETEVGECSQMLVIAKMVLTSKEMNSWRIYLQILCEYVLNYWSNVFCSLFLWQKNINTQIGEWFVSLWTLDNKCIFLNKRGKVLALVQHTA